MINFNNSINTISFQHINFNLNSINNFNLSITNINITDLSNINPLINNFSILNNLNNINNLMNLSNFLIGFNIGLLLSSILSNNTNPINQNNMNFQNLSNNSLNNALLLTLLMLLISLLTNNNPMLGLNSGFPQSLLCPNIGFPNNTAGNLGCPNNIQNNPIGGAFNGIKGNGTAQDFVKIALSQVGKPYVFGAEASPNNPNPRAFDCSELVEWAAKRAGVNIPDGADNQFNYCKKHGTVISVKKALQTPGALLFYRDLGHVMISLGDGRVVEAGNSRVGVVVRPASVHGDKIAYGALIPGLKY